MNHWRYVLALDLDRETYSDLAFSKVPSNAFQRYWISLMAKSWFRIYVKDIICHANIVPFRKYREGRSRAGFYATRTFD